MNKQAANAYRERARAIGILCSCICNYPLEVENTASGHDERCPSEYMTKVYEQLGRVADALPPVVGPPMLRAYAAEWNRIADAAFVCLTGMKTDELAQSILDDAQIATSRARAVALRLEELAYHLEQTREHPR